MMSSGERNRDYLAGSAEEQAASPGDDTQPAPPEHSKAAAADDPSSLLHQVMAETIAREDPLTEEELNALRDVARQHCGTPFDVQPIGVALVQSLLALRYPKLDRQAENWSAMTEQIAESLFAVPAGRARLQKMWQRLCETVQ